MGHRLNGPHPPYSYWSPDSRRQKRRFYVFSFLTFSLRRGPTPICCLSEENMNSQIRSPLRSYSEKTLLNPQRSNTPSTQNTSTPAIFFQVSSVKHTYMNKFVETTDLVLETVPNLSVYKKIRYVITFGSPMFELVQINPVPTLLINVTILLIAAYLPTVPLVNPLTLPELKCPTKSCAPRMSDVSTENLLKLRFINNGIVARLFVTLLYTLAYPFLVREVLTIRPTSARTVGPQGRHKQEIRRPTWLVVTAHRTKLPALTSKKLILPVNRRVNIVVVGTLTTTFIRTLLVILMLLVNRPVPLLLNTVPVVSNLPRAVTTGNTTCNPLQMEVCNKVCNRAWNTLGLVK